jgi:hypothetical protein
MTSNEVAGARRGTSRNRLHIVCETIITVGGVEAGHGQQSRDRKGTTRHIYRRTDVSLVIDNALEKAVEISANGIQEFLL